MNRGIALAAAGVCVCMHMTSGAQVPKVIFDTDMTGDCDDCGALAVLHALADLGEVEILGCIASFGANPYVVGCIDAINTYYGRGGLPIGAEHGDFGTPESSYVEAVAKDTERYGHRFVTKTDVPEQVSVYRKLLAAQPNGSVTIVTVGRLKGLYALLVSGPDAYSELPGDELVKQKVLRWVCMGGAYPNEQAMREANFCTRGGSEYTKKAVELFPMPAVFCGFEIGEKILTGPKLLEQPDDNPVARAYRLFFDALGGESKVNQRPSWDQTAVLYAVRGAGPRWDLVDKGSNFIHEDGTNEWRQSPVRDHAYIVQRQTPEESAAEITALMTQTPRARK